MHKRYSVAYFHRTEQSLIWFSFCFLMPYSSWHSACSVSFRRALPRPWLLPPPSPEKGKGPSYLGALSDLIYRRSFCVAQCMHERLTYLQHTQHTPCIIGLHVILRKKTYNTFHTYSRLKHTNVHICGWTAHIHSFQGPKFRPLISHFKGLQDF